MIHRIFALVPTAVLLLAQGCTKMDNFLFDNVSLASYEPLSTAVIPDSARELVVMESQEKKIYGYFIRSSGALPQYTIFYNHGNFEHLRYYWDRAELLYRTGCNVFIYDYQGFGRSEGVPSESALYSDGRAALAYLRSRPDVVDSNIVFYGFSLGNVVTYDIAAREFSPLRFISEAPFASADALVKSGTILDVPGSYVAEGEYNNAEKAKEIRAPFLLLWADKDKKFAFGEHAEPIFNNARNPKYLVRVPNALHSSIPGEMGVEKYLELVRTFILTGSPAQ